MRLTACAALPSDGGPPATMIVSRLAVHNESDRGGGEVGEMTGAGGRWPFCPAWADLSEVKCASGRAAVRLQRCNDRLGGRLVLRLVDGAPGE